MTESAGDLARRVAKRRQELGLEPEEVARRAGMDPGYLDYLEHNVAVLRNGQLLRLAAALDTTVAHLYGGDIDGPPGRGRAGPHPHLDVMSEEECRDHLAGGGVGHFVFAAPQGPIALPVNFGVIEGDVVFHTRVEGPLAAAAGSIVSLEVDQIDDAMSEGWSVLLTGRARLVDDPAELDRIAELGVEPWPGGRREAVIRIETDAISGRRIHQRSR